MTTCDRRLVAGVAGEGGYRPIVAAPGEPHRISPLCSLPDDWQEIGQPLLAFAHLTDLHVMDAQSPARLELLNRFADPDSPWRRQLPTVGSYRPQEPFTTQVVEAMVQALNALSFGPVSGAPIELAVVTGDMTDNAQLNELRNYIGLLDGKTEIRPGSGDPGRWEGVGGDADGDERYWHPDGDIDDLAWRRHGFPIVEGALHAACRPFVSTGLRMPWLAVHGNHDHLMQGTVPPATPRYAAVSTGSRKLMTPSVDLDPVVTVAEFNRCDPVVLDMVASSFGIDVTADRERRHVSRAQHVAAHLESPGLPRGHGYTPQNLATGTTYYIWETSRVRCVMLDTVNEHGGWQGSLDREQFDWLVEVLEASNSRPVVLFSHHPLDTLVNDRNADGEPRRVLADELRDTLLGFPCVIAWINGHTHRHRVAPACRPDGSVAWWEITTSAHVDWPQQSRVIELMEIDEQLIISSTVLDTWGALAWEGRRDPLGLAGLSREIAANDWQRAAGSARDRSGSELDRNVVVSLSLAGRFKHSDSAPALAVH